MTNEQILKQAIEKAVKNGYAGGNCEGMENYWSLDDYYSLIFLHDFAKAIWGKRVGCVVPPKVYIDVKDWEKSYSLPVWKYHLQQMVLEKEPLQYLKKFL